MKYMALKKQTFWMFALFAVVISVEYVAIITNNFAANIIKYRSWFVECSKELE